MKKLSYVLVAAFLAGLPTLALAAGTIDGGTKQAINWTAIGMFVAFVGLTLGITYWAAKQTASAADFYSAGGGITGFQNGLAIAGDYMSAASFLGISGLVYTSGYDGLIYSVGWLVGWPIVTLGMVVLAAAIADPPGSFFGRPPSNSRLAGIWRGSQCPTPSMPPTRLSTA